MTTKLPFLFALIALTLSLLGASSTDLGSLTGGIPTTASSTGTTTTGGTTGGQAVLIYLVDEKKSSDTYAWVTGSPGSWQHLTGRHVVGLKVNSIHVNPPSDPHLLTYSHGETIAVEEGTEFGPPSGYTPTGGTHAGVNICGINIPEGNSFLIQTSDTGAISGGRHLAYWLHLVDDATYDNAPPSHIDTWTRTEVVLQKLSCNDAGLTTRKTYGQANTAGELPADPNAPLRYPSYASWDYKGGLFVGNMPFASGDASGTARTDLFVQGGSSYVSTYLFAGLSVYDLGTPSTSGTSGAVHVGVYFPGSSDSLLTSLSETNVTWDHQWTITPGTVTSSTDYTQHPFSDLTLTNGNTDDYIVFPLSKPSAMAPASSLTGICLATVDEATAVSGNSQIWHYLASREWSSGHSTFPFSDSNPRVWVVMPYP